MSTEDTEVDIRLENYPPSGSDMAIKQVVFGGPGPITLLLTADVDEETDSSVIRLTVGGAAEHEEIPEFLADIIELLTVIAESSETHEALQAAIDKEDWG